MLFRSLQRLLREALEDPLAAEVLFGRLVKGGEVIADAPEGEAARLTLRFAAVQTNRPGESEKEPEPVDAEAEDL